jgi:GDP-mannose 6-dehydrogenase
MQLSVYGLGYVGAVAAGCLAAQGHEVVVVDPDADKVDMIRRGVAPVNEPGLGRLIRQAVGTGRLRVTTDLAEAIAGSTVTSICGGTADDANRHDLSRTLSLCEEIGGALWDKQKFHAIVLRSALRPGTVRDFIIPALEQASGKRAGVEFGVAIYPEFLRPGSAIEDYLNPPAIILGATDDETLARLREMDIALQAPEMVLELEEAEAMMQAARRSIAPRPALPRTIPWPALPMIADNPCGG